MEPKPPLTTDQQIAQILLAQETKTRSASSGNLRYQIYAAAGLSVFFLLLTWHKSGFSWAFSNVLLSDFYVLTLAIGNPWRWAFHRNDPDFTVTQASRIVSWILLLASLIFGYVLTPSSLGSMPGLDGNASLQQAQQLQNELGN